MSTFSSSRPRTPRPIRFLLCVYLGIATVAGTSAQNLTVFDDDLGSDFQDWSWAVRDFQETGTVHSGQFAVSMQPDFWTGLYFHHGSGLDVAEYDAIRFWIHGGASGGQVLGFVLQLGSSELGSVAVSDYLPTSFPIPSWVEVEIPFVDLGVSAGGFDGLIFQDWTGGDQSVVFFDDISLLPNTVVLPTIAIAVDPNLDRRPIDPRIYGVNLGEADQMEDLRFPLRRWGGNATTRYNWRVDVSNRAVDYFFQNIANSDPGTLPHGSAVDRYIDSTLSNGGEVVLTVPLIGWTPTATDRQKRWGFSLAKYGPQDRVECDLYDPPPAWCSSDSGDGECAETPNDTGFCVDGWIVGNDPSDTSDAIDADFVTDWMAHIAGRVGSASGGGVGLFALDNEPMLWSSTHRDVHPDTLGYDESWTRTLEIASAIKAADGAAEILGPAVWGWCAYFSSASDAAFDNGSCIDGPDRQAHGGLAYLAWYLEQVCAQESSSGTRLVDYLDIHYYPQGNVSGLGGNSDSEDAETSARRLRSTKELYDPSYVSESWIDEPVYLIPRMRDWIDQHCPGMGLALTEYKWGPDDGASGALAQAEVLAILGREGVDIASRWIAPEPGSKVEDAYRIYLDYDGAGSRVAGESVRAVSDDVDAVGAYSVRSADQELFVLLFNKATVEREVEVHVAGGIEGDVELFGFEPDRSLGARGTLTPIGDRVALSLAARSAMLAVIGQTADPECPGGESTLCLREDRFAVEVEWLDFSGNSGMAVPHRLSSEAGYFTFFDMDNAEVFIKILDACVPPWNSYWVFDSHLSNVEYTIRISDLQTGQTRTIFNPSGYVAPSVLGTDTIFTECGGGGGSGLPPSELIDTTTLPPNQPPIVDEYIDSAVVSTCVENENTVCLTGGRFRVYATFQDFAGGGGPARWQRLTSDSGYATFFDESNVELFLKVLDACSTTAGNFWVFVGGLSNVAIEIFVEDTETGKVWHETNPSHRSFATTLDTGTFFTDCP